MTIPGINVLTIGIDSTNHIAKDHELYNLCMYHEMGRDLANLSQNEIYTKYIPEIDKTICVYHNENDDVLQLNVKKVMDFCKENNFKLVAFNDHELKGYNFNSVFSMTQDYDIEVNIVIEK